MWITRALLKFSLLLAMLIGVTVGLIRAQPYSRNILGELGIEPPNSECPYASWLSICPGHTSKDEALAILKAHPWIGELEVTSGALAEDVLLSWSWSGEQPEWIEHSERGSMIFSSFKVNIMLGGRVPYGLLWLQRQPEQVTFVYRYPSPSPEIWHYASYWNVTFAVYTSASCPLGFGALVWEPSQFLISTPTQYGWIGDTIDFVDMKDYRMLPDLNRWAC